MSSPALWLLLDAGNTALKWVLMTADGRVGPAHGTRRNAPDEDLTAALVAEWRGLGGGEVRGAFGCAVASPSLMRAVDKAVSQSFALPVQWLDSQSRFEHGGVVLRNGYRDCTQLGVDRWNSLIAARAAHPGRALVVVTAGTATTVDGVTADGSFVGGVIAPGVRLMYEALAKGTARLSVSRGRLVSYPDNTDDAIASGVYGSQLGLVERFVRNFRVEHGNPLVVLTGGHAAQLAPYVGVGTSLPSVVREENLVLRGVYLRACELTAAPAAAAGAAQ